MRFTKLKNILSLSLTGTVSWESNLLEDKTVRVELGESHPGIQISGIVFFHSLIMKSDKTVMSLNMSLTHTLP